MPKRILTLSRTEPARSMLLILAILTLVMQTATLLPFITPLAYAVSQGINVSIVAAFCIWAITAAVKNNVKHMSLSSFWLFCIWLFTGLSRILFSPDPTLMLWAPFLIVAAAFGVVYLYMSHLRKGGGIK